MKHEHFINQIYTTTNHISKVMPCADLFTKIEFKINQTKTVPFRITLLTAASIAALLLLNIAIVTIRSKYTDNSITALSVQLQKSNQLYN